MKLLGDVRQLTEPAPAVRTLRAPVQTTRIPIMELTQPILLLLEAAAALLFIGQFCQFVWSRISRRR